MRKKLFLFLYSLFLIFTSDYLFPSLSNLLNILFINMLTFKSVISVFYIPTFIKVKIFVLAPL